MRLKYLEIFRLERSIRALNPPDKRDITGSLIPYSQRLAIEPSSHTRTFTINTASMSGRGKGGKGLGEHSLLTLAQLFTLLFSQQSSYVGEDLRSQAYCTSLRSSQDTPGLRTCWHHCGSDKRSSCNWPHPYEPMLLIYRLHLPDASLHGLQAREAPRGTGRC